MDRSTDTTEGTLASRVTLVRDAMTPRLERIHLRVSLAEAAKRFRDADVGVLPVYDGVELLGMLSDRDIVIRAIADGKDPSKTPVEDAFQPGVHYCHEEERLGDAVGRMGRLGVRRLVVRDASDQPSGILSLSDAAPIDAAESYVAQALAESRRAPEGRPAALQNASPGGRIMGPTSSARGTGGS